MVITLDVEVCENGALVVRVGFLQWRARFAHPTANVVIGQHVAIDVEPGPGGDGVLVCGRVVEIVGVTRALCASGLAFSSARRGTFAITFDDAAPATNVSRQTASRLCVRDPGARTTGTLVFTDRVPDVTPAGMPRRTASFLTR